MGEESDVFIQRCARDRGHSSTRKFILLSTLVVFFKCNTFFTHYYIISNDSSETRVLNMGFSIHGTALVSILMTAWAGAGLDLRVGVTGDTWTLMRLEENKNF